MPKGKHSHHKGGRPRSIFVVKLVKLSFASEEEYKLYMALSPRERVEMALYLRVEDAPP